MSTKAGRIQIDGAPDRCPVSELDIGQTQRDVVKRRGLAYSYHCRVCITDARHLLGIVT